MTSRLIARFTFDKLAQLSVGPRVIGRLSVFFGAEAGRHSHEILAPGDVIEIHNCGPHGETASLRLVEIRSFRAAVFEIAPSPDPLAVTIPGDSISIVTTDDDEEDTTVTVVAQRAIVREEVGIA